MDQELERIEAVENPTQAQLDSHNELMARLNNQVNEIYIRAALNFAQQVGTRCDITIGQGSGPDEDAPLTRWSHCADINEAGEVITKQSADQIPVGISIQEYRLSSIDDEQPEEPTRPVPLLQAGQYVSEESCKNFAFRGSSEAGECRQVRRGHYSYWVDKNPPPAPRFSSSRVYQTATECAAVHASCHSVGTEHTTGVDSAGNPSPGTVTETETVFVASFVTYEYNSADRCADYHRTCEMVSRQSNLLGGGTSRQGVSDYQRRPRPRFETVYVPRITGSVYTDSGQCGDDHGACYEYRRDTDGDGDIDTDDEFVYVPYPSNEITVTVTRQGDGPTTRTRETVPGSDSRAPDRSLPDEGPVTEPQIPGRAVDVDGTGSPTEYATGDDCTDGGGAVCGLGADGNWYRLR